MVANEKAGSFGGSRASERRRAETHGITGRIGYDVRNG